MGKRLQFTPLKPKKERLIYFTTDMNSYVKAKNEFNERVDHMITKYRLDSNTKGQKLFYKGE
jgi:hypothetical protein